jgi:hypothetical protein
VTDNSSNETRIYDIPEPLMRRLYNVLKHYANETSYRGERTGGVVAGCPRGPAPTPDQLVWSARWMLRALEHDVLKRDAWDWIGKYEPTGPHCDTCRCGQPHETTSYSLRDICERIRSTLQHREDGVTVEVIDEARSKLFWSALQDLYHLVVKHER